MSCLTLTLTLIGKIVQKIRFKETERGKEGEKGGSAHLAVEHAGARREKIGRPKGARLTGIRPKGARLAGIRPQGRRGQAARRRRAHPLGSAHAGEGAGDGAGTSLLRQGCSLGDSLR